MPHWTKIVLHDSYDAKGVRRHSDEILDYHLGWKDVRAGEPLSEAVAQHLIAQGESGISRPWKECGDHWHVVSEGGRWQVRMMRPMTAAGSHSTQLNLNKNAISIRIIPTDPPRSDDQLFDRLAVLCKFLMKTYHIPPDSVFSHRELIPGTDCPKAWFMIEEFRTHLITQIFKQ